MRRREFLKLSLAGAATAAADTASASAGSLRGTGDLGIVVERASGSLLIVDNTQRRMLARIDGLGDLSHASAVFSRCGQFAFVFGRDGAFTKVDLLNARIEARVVQAGNSIGGAISDDGRLIAVANYDPGGIKLFDPATLAQIDEVPARYAGEQRAKPVGIADAPGRRFLFSLYEAGEIWLIDCASGGPPQTTKFRDIGKLPYDGLITGDGRYYIAGLFGEDGLVCLDLWAEQPRPQRILAGYGKGETKLPVYKMPHLRGWAQAGDRMLLPAVGRNEVLVAETPSFREIGRVAVHGQPVFVMARPDGRQAWVNFAHPNNDTVQVIDTRSLAVVHELRPGPAVLHMEFTSRGHEAWVSVRDADRVDVYDTRSFAKLAEIPARKPSGILFTSRAHRTGL
jgi:protein NirF